MAYQTQIASSCGTVCSANAMTRQTVDIKANWEEVSDRLAEVFRNALDEDSDDDSEWRDTFKQPPSTSLAGWSGVAAVFESALLAETELEAMASEPVPVSLEAMKPEAMASFDSSTTAGTASVGDPFDNIDDDCETEDESIPLYHANIWPTQECDAEAWRAVGEGLAGVFASVTLSDDEDDVEVEEPVNVKANLLEETKLGAKAFERPPAYSFDSTASTTAGTASIGELTDTAFSDCESDDGSVVFHNAQEEVSTKMHLGAQEIEILAWGTVGKRVAEALSSVNLDDEDDF